MHKDIAMPFSNDMVKDDKRNGGSAVEDAMETDNRKQGNDEGNEKSSKKNAAMQNDNEKQEDDKGNNTIGNERPAKATEIESDGENEEQIKNATDLGVLEICGVKKTRSSKLYQVLKGNNVLFKLPGKTKYILNLPFFKC